LHKTYFSQSFVTKLYLNAANLLYAQILL